LHHFPSGVVEQVYKLQGDVVWGQWIDPKHMLPFACSMGGLRAGPTRCKVDRNRACVSCMSGTAAYSVAAHRWRLQLLHCMW
jgi:hypothetical protein